MNVIDIGTVLNKLDDYTDERTSETKVFGIRFLSEKGFREMTCRKNFKNYKQRQPAGERTKQNYNLQKNGVMRLFDVAKQEHRSVRPDTMFMFRDHKSKEWIRIWH
jgi:hypothetical protein